MRNHLLSTLAGLLVSAGVVGAAENVFEAYPLSGTDLSAAAALAREVVGPEGTVTIDEKGRRLLVLAPAAAQQKVADIARKLNPPARNIRIDVRFRGAGRQEQREASLGAQGQVVLQSGGRSQGSISLQPKLVNELSTQSSDTVQTLLVASGREASLRVGEEVPYVDWMMEYGVAHGWLTGRVNWQRVGASLVVEPTLIGDGPELRVRVTPELSGVVEGRPERIRFAQAATELVVRDGETLQFGGFDQHREFYDRFLIGSRRGGQAQSLAIELTPRVQPAGRPAGAGERR